MTTTETLQHSAAALADTTAHAVSELAERAKKSELAERAKRQVEAVAETAADKLSETRKGRETPRHRRRVVLLGAAFVGLGLAAMRWVRKKGGLQGVEDRVIDLTGGRTNESTVERLGAEGLDPVGRDDLR